MEDRRVRHLDLLLGLFSTRAWSGISDWEVGLFGSPGGGGPVSVLVLRIRELFIGMEVLCLERTVIALELLFLLF